MRAGLAVALALTAGLACGAEEPSGPPSSAPVLPDSVLASFGDAPTTLAVDTVATGLVVPWGLAFAPDGRIFVTERPGRVRVVGLDGLDPEPWATLEVYGEHPVFGPESGLLGIALAPDFGTSGHVYVFATTWRSDGDRTGGLPTRLWRRLTGLGSPEGALPFKSQVIRLTDREGRGTDPQVVIDDLPANHYHAGGGLAFGPDGKLWLSVGDVIEPTLVGRRGSLAGKILRYEADGSIPADNPDPGSPVWATGLRNTQAFTWLPDGTLIGGEHGPSGMVQEGGRFGQDELNILVPGGDYGWPSSTGWRDTTGVDAPIWVWQTGFAPGGLVAYAGPWEPWRGNLLAAALRGGRIERLELRGEGAERTIGAREVLLQGALGRIRTLAMGPDGHVYVTTSNRDARGGPRPFDDLLLRLRPGDGS